MLATSMPSIAVTSNIFVVESQQQSRNLDSQSGLPVVGKMYQLVVLIENVLSKQDLCNIP